MNLSGKRILITGGSGFLATNLARHLSSTDCQVTLIHGHNSAALNEPIPGKIERLVGDLRDQKFWRTCLTSADFIFHFAAQTSVYFADENPMEDWKANVLPMLTLLETCRSAGCRPMIAFAGTATQFGITEILPVDESCPDRPITIYDRHKLAAESYLEHYVRHGWARGATLRLPNVYGPGPTTGKPDRGILNKMMRRALAGESLTLYGEGQQIRDYLFVADVIDAFLAAAANSDAVNGEHFVVSSGESHTLLQAFELIAECAWRLTGAKATIDRVLPPEGLSPIEERSYCGNSERFRNRTGWIARTSLEDGINITLKAIASERVLSQ